MAVSAQTAVGDSAIWLRGVDVTADVGSQRVRTDSTGAIYMGMKWLRRMPKVLGDADPLRLMQAMPGVHTNAEYDCGIHIDGCETSHCGLMLDGVPVYGATHLLGLFSVFNSAHFSSLRLARNTYASSSQPRLGAEVDMLLPKRADAVADGVEGAVGLMSSQATWRHRLSPAVSLLLSARRSYLNMLYGSLLKVGDMQLEYGFGDYNATLLYSPTPRDNITLNVYGGNDTASMGEHDYQANIGLDWGNALASAEWTRRTDGYGIEAEAYVTRFRSELEVTQEILHSRIESSIREAGVRAAIDIGRWDMGVRMSRFYIQPQSPQVSGVEGQQADCSDVSAYTANAQYTIPLGRRWRAQLGCKVHCTDTQCDTYWDVDPSVVLRMSSARAGDVSVSLGSRSQYLWQTGFSSKGMPTEFWMSVAESGISPQRAVGVEATYAKSFADGRYKVDAHAFCNRMTHQVEYHGDLLELLSAYSLRDNLLYGEGHNVGLSLMLQKAVGRLSGWIAYSWQRVRRQFGNEGYTGLYPSNHERPHELNVVATCRIFNRLDFGSCMVFASGTPFTAPVEMFIVNGNFVTQYGPHNGNRLPAYFRLDLSLNYDFRSRTALTHGLNLTLYNATAHSNAVFYRLRYMRDEPKVGYKPLCFLVKVMPSVSYYFRF